MLKNGVSVPTNLYFNNVTFKLPILIVESPKDICQMKRPIT